MIGPPVLFREARVSGMDGQFTDSRDVSAASSTQPEHIIHGRLGMSTAESLSLLYHGISKNSLAVSRSNSYIDFGARI
jgi:hypothetical protein